MKKAQQDLNAWFERPAVLFDLDGTLIDTLIPMRRWIFHAGITIPAERNASAQEFTW